MAAAAVAHAPKPADEASASHSSESVGCGRCGAGHSDQRWLDAVTEQAALLSHVSNLFHTVPQVAALPAPRGVAVSFSAFPFFQVWRPAQAGAPGMTLLALRGRQRRAAQCLAALPP